jgi:cobalt-zinc-cadmium efflux system protein
MRLPDHDAPEPGPDDGHGHDRAAPGHDHDSHDHKHDDHKHDDHKHDDHKHDGPSPKLAKHDDHNHDDHKHDGPSPRLAKHDDHSHDHKHDGPSPKLAKHDDHSHDDHGHGHAHGGHGHDHSHHAPPDRLTRAFLLGMALNIAFVVIGVIAGFAAHSTALLADAAHNMGDVLGLGMAWGAMALARRERTARHTYGLRRTTILAALGNGGLVVFAIGGVVWEAIQRLGTTAPVDGGIVAVVAAIGVGLNVLAALLFARGRANDMNIRGAFLHLMADAAVSAGVVVSGLIVWQTGWAWIDPAASLAVSAVILVGTWKLLREATNLLLDAVPDHIDSTKVEAFLAGVPSVASVHDLHIWSLSTTEVALTAHLIVPWDTCSPTLIADLSAEIARRFKIGHVTLQLEPAGHIDCEQGVLGAV